jgi:glycosyltransferase involved in cell wall biosynthesis
VRTIVAAARRADVVHVPLPGDIPFLGAVLAQVMRKRLLVRYGGSWQPELKPTVPNRLMRAWMRIFAGGRNVMIATGKGDEPPARGMHWLHATALSRAEVGAITPVYDRAASDPPRLIYVGRLSPEKGVICLLEALALLKRSGVRPLPQLALAGDGPERRRLEDAVNELGCQDQVSFLGQLDRRELSIAFGQADVCVQPSLTEGWSKAWLDAMAHGLPVLTTSVGAARTVIGTNGERGWLVPPGDAQALATTLEAILRDPFEWPALRRRCRAYAEQFTVEAWAERVGQICARQWNVRFIGGKLYDIHAPEERPASEMRTVSRP